MEINKISNSWRYYHFSENNLAKPMLDRSLRLIYHRPDHALDSFRIQTPYTNFQFRLTETDSFEDTMNMDSNSRKRKMESEDSNDEDGVSLKSDPPKSLTSMETFEDKNTYGLKYEYLKSLGIIPPLDKWIHVECFRCDKSELKEILELAGHVVICSMICARKRYARVMYSHPLEAVQAISMLNGQVFYGQKLQITMVKCPSDTIILPKGLSNIGPGLGMQGMPLPDIVEHYRRYLKNQSSQIDAYLFRNADDKDDDNKSEIDGMDGTNASNEDANSNKSSADVRKLMFKVKNVEDSPDNESVGSETKSKKAKTDFEDRSDSDLGSEDGKVASDLGEPKPISVVVPSRGDPRLEVHSDASSSPKPNPEMPKPDQRSLPPGPGPQNHSIPMVYPPGHRQPVPPPQGRMCPAPPRIGPIMPPGPMGPFAPTVRPLGPPNSIPPVRGMGPHMGPPARPMIPTAAHTGPPGSHTPNRVQGPFPQVPSSPFQPSVPNMANILPNPRLGPHPTAGPNMPVQASNQPITLEFRNVSLNS